MHNSNSYSSAFQEEAQDTFKNNWIFKICSEICLQSPCKGPYTVVAAAAEGVGGQHRTYGYHIMDHFNNIFWVFTHRCTCTSVPVFTLSITGMPIGIQSIHPIIFHPLTDIDILQLLSDRKQVPSSTHSLCHYPLKNIYLLFTFTLPGFAPWVSNGQPLCETGWTMFILPASVSSQTASVCGCLLPSVCKFTSYFCM